MKIRFELDTGPADSAKPAKTKPEPYAGLKHLAEILTAVSAILATLLAAYLKIKS